MRSQLTNFPHPLLQDIYAQRKATKTKYGSLCLLNSYSGRIVTVRGLKLASYLG